MRKKIVVWCGADFTHFCMLYYLQKKLDADFYCIADITPNVKDFFNTQKLVNFKKIWFFHDHITKLTNPDIDYLAAFEKKYKINLWNLALNERMFYRFNDFHKFTRDEILSIYQQACVLFENIINEVKPDFFITKETAFHHLELFYEMCLKSGIQSLMLNQPNLGKRSMISKKCRIPDYMSKRKKHISKNRDFHELQQYLESLNTSESIKNYLEQHANSKLDLLKAFLIFMTSNNSSIHTNYNYFGRTKIKVLSNEILIRFKKANRRNFINKNLVQSMNSSKKFVYFPLSVDMERNLLIGSPYFTNQIELIKNIAQSLPVEYSLFVKENPSQESREWRSTYDYKRILEIPNVTLFHPSFSSKNLIESCSLLVTIGGSSGLEATFYGKPSIVFSDVGYSTLPSVFKVENTQNLPQIIKKALKTKVNSSDLDQYLHSLEKEMFSYDTFNFASILKNKLYLGGNLHDIKISESDIMSIISTQKDTLELLAEEHLKKIKRMPKN